MYPIRIPTAPGPRAISAQEIIVLQNNCPMQHVDVCSSVRTSTMLLLQMQMQMQPRTQTQMLKIESKISVRASILDSCKVGPYEIINRGICSYSESLLATSLFGYASDMKK